MQPNQIKGPEVLQNIDQLYSVPLEIVTKLHYLCIQNTSKEKKKIFSHCFKVDFKQTRRFKNAKGSL